MRGSNLQDSGHCPMSFGYPCNPIDDNTKSYLYSYWYSFTVSTFRLLINKNLSTNFSENKIFLIVCPFQLFTLLFGTFSSNLRVFLPPWRPWNETRFSACFNIYLPFFFICTSGWSDLNPHTTVHSTVEHRAYPYVL